jgi:hypothetical protein
MKGKELCDLLGITVPAGADTIYITADQDSVRFIIEGKALMPAPVPSPYYNASK